MQSVAFLCTMAFAHDVQVLDVFGIVAAHHAYFSSSYDFGGAALVSATADAFGVLEGLPGAAVVLGVVLAHLLFPARG